MMLEQGKTSLLHRPGKPFSSQHDRKRSGEGNQSGLFRNAGHNAIS